MNTKVDEPLDPDEPTFDLDDYEYLQDQAEGFDVIDGGFAEDIFSGALNSAPRIDMYRSWVYPDMYEDEREAVLDNWSDDDLENYT